MSDQSSVSIKISLWLGDDEVLNESTSSFEIAHQILGRQQEWLEKEQALAENRAEQEAEEIMEETTSLEEKATKLENTYDASKEINN